MLSCPTPSSRPIDRLGDLQPSQAIYEITAALIAERQGQPYDRMDEGSGQTWKLINAAIKAIGLGGIRTRLEVAFRSAPGDCWIVDSLDKSGPWTIQTLFKPSVMQRLAKLNRRPSQTIKPELQGFLERLKQRGDA